MNLTTEEQIKARSEGMTNDELARFVSDEVVPNLGKWPLAMVNRVERILSKRMDEGILVRIRFKDARNTLDNYIKSRRKEQNRSAAPATTFTSDVDDVQIRRMIRDGAKVEDIARECGVTVNYVVCTKREMTKPSRESNDE